MSKLKTMKQAWDSYERAVIPTHAGPQQRYDMRMCFYSGATALLGMMQNGMSGGEHPTEQDVQVLRDLQQELDDWQAEVEADQHK